MKNLFIIGLTAVLAAVVSFTVACHGNGKENEDGLRVTQTGNGEEEMNQIKQDYFNQLVKPINVDALFEDLEIEKEYGLFEGYIVVRFNSVFNYPALYIPIEINGVEVNWEFANRIIAWKDGQVFTLISAQENNILSQKSLREIALIDNLLYRR